MRVFLVIVLLLMTHGLCLSSAFAAEKQPEEVAPKKVTPQILVESGATLVGKRNLTIEPGLEYSHISSNNLDVSGFSVLPSVVVGLIEVEKIRRDVLTPSLTFRFGLSNEFEFNLKIPYSIRYDRYTRGVFPDSVGKKVDENDIGDIEGGLVIHLLSEKGVRPEILAGLTVKSRTGKDPYGLETQELSEGNTVPAELPTGSGHWGFEPSLTFVKTADPAVLFGTISYFDHIQRDTGVNGTVDPGNSIGFSFGVAYALNDRLALSSGYSQKFFDRTKIEGRKIEETDITLATLQFGGTYAYTDDLALSVSIGFGLTPDSPDIQLSIKTPIRFSF